jgi:glycosyltransferase involved in cell wall biosynthesis
VPNAIDLEEFSHKRSLQSAQNRLGLATGRFVIGAVGRLSREKGFSFLIRALGRLVDQSIDAELWIAGEGPQRASLESLASNLGLRDRVQLLGHRDDVIDLYHGMDAFVVSSAREGLPNVLLEAMALELPVVATRVAGVPDLIRDGENGLLVDPGSTEALADALRRLAENSGLRRRLGEAARRTVEDSHDFKKRMETILGIYDRILSLQ